ncbi:hypothetical protein IFM89_029046, partial [Coptis chinensis]
EIPMEGFWSLRYSIKLVSDSIAQLPLNSTWSLGGADWYGLQTGATWPLGGGSSSSGFSHINNTNSLAIPSGWRTGDWICNCGFHNYSSRGECKKCNASLPSGTTSSMVNTRCPGMFPSHGTKRLASEEFCGEWENKRLNAGDINNHFSPSQFVKVLHNCIVYRRSVIEQSNGVMEIGCAQTAATTTMHHGRSAIGMCSFFSICPLGLYN